MARPKKIEEKNQIHAALSSNRSVYDIVGKRTFPYDELTIKDYETKLEGMNFSDLQRHALEVAHILPNIDKRERLVSKLKEEYLKKQYSSLHVKSPFQNEMTEEQKKAALEILKRGRN